LFAFERGGLRRVRPGTTMVRLAGERRAQRTPASRCIRSGARPHHWFL